MAKHPCENCKKFFPMDESACPHCGTHQSAAHKKKWAKVHKRNKLCIIGGIIFIALIMLLPKPDKTDAPKLSAEQSLVEQSIVGVASLENWKETDLAGGKAILVNDAGYWVKDGVIYTTNGVANSYSPGISYAPPSINQSLVEKAVAGQLGEEPTTIPMGYLDFFKNLQANLSATPQHYTLKKTVYNEYEMPEAGMVRAREYGGNITDVYVGVRFNKNNEELNIKSQMLLFNTMTTLLPDVSKEELGANLFTTFRAGAKQKDTNKLDLKLHGLDFSFEFDPRGYVNMNVVKSEV
ncbi:MAG: hypothetical protein ACNI27_11055 [Desulfovibrio sp.]